MNADEKLLLRCSGRALAGAVWVLLALAGALAPAHGAGRVDPTFGVNGTVTSGLDNPSVGLTGSFVRMLSGPDERFFAIAYGPGDNCCYPRATEVQLYDRNGQPIWSNPYYLEASETVTSAAVHPSGGLLFGDSSGVVRALDAAGAPTPVVGDRQTVAMGAGVTALAVRTDGRLLIAIPGAIGYDVDGNEYALDDGWSLACLNPDGTPDTTFGSNGVLRAAQVELPPLFQGSYSSRIYHLLVQEDGRIVVGAMRTVRLNPDGTLDTGFTAATGLALADSQFSRLRDGRWLTVRSGRSPRPDSDVSLSLYRADGSIEPSFGASGTVTQDLGERVLGDPAAYEKVEVNLATPDSGNHFFALVWVYSLPPNASTPLSSGTVVARFLRDGRLDPAFGDGGVVQVSSGTNLRPLGLLPLPDGSIIVATDHRIFKVLAVGDFSPGLIDTRLPEPVVFENQGTARIIVSREAGADGAISVAYRLENGSAAAGLDFEAKSGQLNWADGDDSDRVIEVRLIDDGLGEGSSLEYLTLYLETVAGGAIVLAETTRLGISDDGDGADAGGGSSGGGGGSADTWLLCWLFALALRLPRRRPRQ